jgi:hypothetical protein
VDAIDWKIHRIFQTQKYGLSARPLNEEKYAELQLEKDSFPCEFWKVPA